MKLKQEAFLPLIPLVVLCLAGFSARAASLPVVTGVEAQPFAAQVKTLLEACDYIGSPFSDGERRNLEDALQRGDAAKAQQILDDRCLFGVHINPEMRVKVQQGPAKPELVEQGWRDFLVKVHNESGTTARLKVESPNAQRLHNSPESDVAQRWLDATLFDRAPMRESLSGLKLEYRIVQLFSRDAGQREAKISFSCGQGTQDIGYRNEADVLFTAQSVRPVVFRVRDENNQPTIAAFVIRDAQGRIYPPQSKRLAPDFSFHPQVYRADGEAVRLPPGTYQIEVSRGPESLVKKETVKVDGQTKEASFQMSRWIDPSRHGWWSGDHHIHAAGCAHYTKPSEGVHASDMFRHCMGEDLKVGANLTWGPCFDYQKQFFCGTVDKVSQFPYLLRYDVEVSGFGSHESGHLVLLRLKEQIYPGGNSSQHWPKLGLNTLRWAKKQGAVVGPAHSGWGLQVQGNELPTFNMPKFDGIGANEYIVDVTHEVPGPDGKPVPAVDFISTVDTPYVWELNIWYHTLNAGFRTRISGETDFPCIYGERVGLGRSYVQLEKLDYDAWCEGVRQGRNYVGDGRSHLLDFKANGSAMGVNGSEVKLAKAGRVTLTARVAARLDERPNPDLSERPYEKPPYWHLERARVGKTREVPLEVLVNGRPVAKKTIQADGELRDVSFDVDIARSSWVALRILPSSHTNPIFVMVDGKPIRASRQSVQWCLDAVNQCWTQKERFLKAEVEEGRRVYEHARTVYRQRLAECDVN
ncbi:MAG TPA: CehA/McbA family metallohydrolase [Verrucomicrobiae bacterium]|nr:CehA/McbA family metallohydrolase [Verrucomicrobiae bacterium]